MAVDSKGTIWYGVYSHGKLGTLVPGTGEQILYDFPVPFSAGGLSLIVAQARSMRAIGRG